MFGNAAAKMVGRDGTVVLHRTDGIAEVFLVVADGDDDLSGDETLLDKVEAELLGHLAHDEARLVEGIRVL